MSGVWIYQKDKNNYISLMNDMCGRPSINQETADRLNVNFCGPAMEVWVQVGYWYSF
jgi:plasmid maintenance system antidote protein VapI